MRQAKLLLALDGRGILALRVLAVDVGEVLGVIGVVALQHKVVEGVTAVSLDVVDRAAVVGGDGKSRVDLALGRPVGVKAAEPRGLAEDELRREDVLALGDVNAVGGVADFE